MAENRFSLFGFDSPEEVRRRIGKTAGQESIQAAQLAPGRVGVATAGMLGRGIGRLLGQKAPEELKAERVDKVMSDAMLESENDPVKYYSRLAERFAIMGEGQLATQAIEAMRQASVKQAELGINKLKAETSRKKQAKTGNPNDLFGKIDPSKYTQESIDAFEATYDPATETADYGVLVAVPKTPLVSITEKGEGKAEEVFGKGVGERANQRITYAESASKQSRQLDRVALAISRGAETGRFEETLLEMKSLAKTFGMDVGDLSEQEVIRTVSNEMALRLRNPESGLGLTGNTSNRDLEFLKASVVGLARTEGGNVAIINLLQKFNKMQLDMVKEQNRIIKKENKVPRDLDSQLFEWMETYDFFTEEERRDIERQLRPQSAPVNLGGGWTVVERP